MQKILGLTAVLAMVAIGSALADTTFTAASGPKCKDTSKPEFGLWICPGPAGYAAQFADEGNMVSLTLAPSGSIAKAGPTAQWRGAGIRRQSAVDHARWRSKSRGDPDSAAA
jgi:hypothetical protein